MEQAFASWLKSNYPSSSFHQEPERFVCRQVARANSTEKMLDIAEDSAEKNIEMGAPILDDYVLGPKIDGTKYSVDIPRPEGTMGIFHTHPHGWTVPTGLDLWEVITNEDKFFCIGAAGYTGPTRLDCFYGHIPGREREWDELRQKVWVLVGKIDRFNKEMAEKYPTIETEDEMVRKLRYEDMENWLIRRQQHYDKIKLSWEAEKFASPASPFPRVCHWERVMGLTEEE